MGNVDGKISSNRLRKRCSCGKFSTVEITITKIKEEDFGLSRWRSITGYRGWQITLTKAFAYPCDECVGDIVKKLGDNGSIFVTQRSGKGFWETDLP